jgi:hypothetical protein
MKPPAKPTSEKVNKSAFVRSLPATMSAQDVVKAAAAKGIKLGDKFVHTIRYNAKLAAAKKEAKRSPASTSTDAAVPAKRGRGRPRKVDAVHASASSVSHGLEREIERIVEAKVTAILKERLGALLR